VQLDIVNIVASAVVVGVELIGNSFENEGRGGPPRGTGEFGIPVLVGNVRGKSAEANGAFSAEFAGTGISE